MAADHLDAPAVMTDPTTDITDLYAWSDGTGHVTLVMDVNPAATATSRFSTAAQYVFHVDSAATFAGTPTSRRVVCQPYGPSTTAVGVECWVLEADGTVVDYVAGDASAPAGITSTSGALHLFAGLRDDPFFFNLDGFNATRATVNGAAASLTFDAAGCPALDATTSAVLVSALHTDPTSTPPGGTARDHFAGLNVLAIVLDVDATLLNTGGPILSVYASTHAAP